MKILVIEDHPKIRENIVEFLNIKWHTAEGAVHGQEAFLMPISSYDVIILDINMPIMDGREFMQKLRANSIMTPVIVLTSNNDIEDKISLFEIGADDYITKPFDMRELEMRVLSLSRRRSKIIENEIIIWDVVISLSKHKVSKNCEVIELTNKEYAILEFLARNKWFPKTKTDILEAVWGLRESELNFDSITLEVHISSLRKKLGKDIVETIKWVGYMIAND